MGQAVNSVTLATAFDTVASFQPTGDSDDGARSEEKKTDAFQDSWKKGRPWLDYDHASL